MKNVQVYLTVTGLTSKYLHMDKHTPPPLPPVIFLRQTYTQKLL